MLMQQLELIIGGETIPLPITIGLCQGLSFSAHLFTLIMDELTKHIQDKMS